MFNFLKSKNPKVTFFTQVEGLKESAPIKPSINFIPNWFRQVPPNADMLTGTIKKCPGFIDFMKRGFVVPLWCDLYVKLEKTENGLYYEWKTPDPEFNFEIHQQEQFLNHVPQNAKDTYHMILKTDCPWKVLTTEGYSLLQLPMTYDYSEYFDVLPGIIHSDVYHTINQQMCMKKLGEYIIKKGTPLAMYVPFKREEYDMAMEIENEFLRAKRINQMRCIKSKFSNRFSEYKKLIDFKGD
jgi:hypothetical protein